MKIVAIIVLVLLALALYFKSKSSGKKPKKPSRIAKPDRKQSAAADKGGNAYPGVAIKLCANACDAANELQNIRYLSGEAPLLPLPDCHRLDCACKYVHYSDRRDIHEDRRHAYSMKTDLYATTGNQNRREKKERRDAWNEFDDFGD